MPRKGREFELAYADLFKLDSKKYDVQSPGWIKDKITGDDREVDVLIKYKDESGNNRSIAVECRDRKHGEDVMSIEHLIQKKEDLEVDMYVVSTLYKFTENAIKKARHYGVIIETAEMVTKDNIEDLNKEFFYDAFYVIPQLKRISFLLNDGRIMNMSELYKGLNLLDREELLGCLDLFLLSNVDVLGMIEKIGIKTEDFFKYDENYWSQFDNNVFIHDESFPLLSKFHIRGISYSIKFIPKRLSLPINRSLSTFEVGDKKNKAFKAVFGDDDDNITVGYLDDKKIIARAHLKVRENHRLVGGNMTINTIFPEGAKVDFDLNSILDSAITSLDYDKVI